MRTTSYVSLLLAAAGMTVLAACTVKDVDAPALAGPSTLAHSILMTAERDTLTQNGVDFTDIRIVALGPNGQSESIPLRAQIFVDGIPQDFGMLSTKNPVTPTTIRYTAPSPSSLAGGQLAQKVTIGVTPMNSGDFRGELTRFVDINLQPQGVILPSNPTLSPLFDFNPKTPEIGQSVTFDASKTLNSGSVCLSACGYAWDFGDGSTASGIVTTHAFRGPGNYAVRLVVTDARGAQATSVQTVPVANATPPTGAIAVSPTPPVGTNTEVFFNAAQVVWQGRTITGYEWNFGDGSTGTGVATTHRYGGVGTFNVVLTVSDASGAQGRLQTQVVVTAQGGMKADFTFTPATPKVGQQTVFDASASTPSTGASIVRYKFNYGDGTEETSSNPVQSHTYGAAGTVVVTVEVTDSNGKTATATKSVTIAP